MIRHCIFVLISLIFTVCATNVTISGRNILVNGTPFYARGVDYAPTPIGQWPDSKDSKMAWDWYSQPEVYNRDLPYLQELNVNLIRLYTWRNGVSHNDFLDACLARGIYVIAEFVWDWNLYNSGATGQQTMRTNLITMIQNHNHPAIIAWAIGNELNIGDVNDNNVWNFIKTLKDLVHQTEAPSWRPVSSPLCDGGILYNIINQRNSFVDIWMIQLYKGRTFYDFWSKYQTNSQLPLIITEFGIDSYIADQTPEYGQEQQALWEHDLWVEINNNRQVCSGALKFVWSDGWFGCGNLTRHDTCGSSTNAPGGQGNGEWYGMVEFTNTDVRTNGDDDIKIKTTYCTFWDLWRNETRIVPWTNPTNLGGCDKNFTTSTSTTASTGVTDGASTGGTSTTDGVTDGGGAPNSEDASGATSLVIAMWMAVLLALLA